MKKLNSIVFPINRCLGFLFLVSLFLSARGGFELLFLLWEILFVLLIGFDDLYRFVSRALALVWSPILCPRMKTLLLRRFICIFSVD